MMAPNVKIKNATSERRNSECDSKRQNWECDEDGFECQYWEVMALTAELKTDDGDSEPRN